MPKSLAQNDKHPHTPEDTTRPTQRRHSNKPTDHHPDHSAPTATMLKFQIRRNLKTSWDQTSTGHAAKPVAARGSPRPNFHKGGIEVAEVWVQMTSPLKGPAYPTNTACRSAFGATPLDTPPPTRSRSRPKQGNHREDAARGTSLQKDRPGPLQLKLHEPQPNARSPRLGIVSSDPQSPSPRMKRRRRSSRVKKHEGIG